MSQILSLKTIPRNLLVSNTNIRWKSSSWQREWESLRPRIKTHEQLMKKSSKSSGPWMKFLNKESCLQRIERTDCKEQSMKHRNVGSIFKIYTRKHSPTTKVHLRNSMNSRKSIPKLKMTPINRARSSRTKSSLIRNVINKSRYIPSTLMKSKLNSLSWWTGKLNRQTNRSDSKSRT